MRLSSGCGTLLSVMDNPKLTDASMVYLASTILIVSRGENRLAAGRRNASVLLAQSAKDKELVLRGVHPDLIELTSVTGKETIGIAQVRNVIHQAQFAPTQARRKVCLLPEAEQLTIEAANALLKILEEPPRGFIFLFLTENQRDLLPTIVSRSRVIHLMPSTDSQLLRSLISAGYSQTDARYLASMAQNDDELSQLVSHIENLAEAREHTLKQTMEAEDSRLVDLAIGEDPFLQHAATYQLLCRLRLGNRELAVNGATAIARAGRERASQLLDLMLVVCFSALRETVMEKGSLDNHKRDVSKHDLTSWTSACRYIQRAQRALQRYTCTEGVLMWLLLSMHRGE